MEEIGNGPLRAKGNVAILSAKSPFTVIAKPVRTLAVAIRTPVSFPLRLKIDEETDCHDRSAVSQ